MKEGQKFFALDQSLKGKGNEKKKKERGGRKKEKRREKNKGCNLSSYNGYFGKGNASKNPARYTKCTVPEF